MSELYELRLRNDLENRFLVVGVKPYYVYRDNQKTDAIAGYVYDVIPLSDKSIGVCSIKVPGQTAIKKADVIDRDIVVGFENIKFTPYYDSRAQKRKVSIKADRIAVERARSR